MMTKRSQLENCENKIKILEIHEINIKKVIIYTIQGVAGLLIL